MRESKMIIRYRRKGKKLCKIEGCKKIAHNAFGKDCVCYKHADKEKKQCKQCGLRVGRNKGDLCNHCFAKTKKRMTPMAVLIRYVRTAWLVPLGLQGVCARLAVSGRQTRRITWGGYGIFR